MREWMKQAGSLASSMRKRYIAIPMLIFLLVPTILSLLMGAEFVYLPFRKVPTIIVNHDHSEIVQNLIQMISDNRTFDVIAYADKEDDLEEAFCYNKALTDIVIPEYFSEDLLNGRKTKIMIFNDGTLPTVASGMRSTMVETLKIIKSRYTLKLTEERGIPPQAAMNLITPIGYMTKAISNPSKNVAYMMMEGTLLTIVQIGARYVGACVRERGSFGRLMKRAKFVTGIACVPALGCIVTRILCFEFPYKSSLWAGTLITVFTYFGITLFGILQNLGTGEDCEEAVQKYSTIGFAVLLAGYTFPVISMPQPCKFLTWFMPNTYYIVPFRDMTLVEHSFLSEAHHILWLMGFCMVMVLVVAKKFRDAETEPGETSADGPRTGNGMAGI